MSAPFELFHAISDPSSAKVRRYIVDHGFEAVVRFRNVAYAEVQEALARHGDAQAPALWDGARLHQGADAIIARLAAHQDVGRAE